MTEHKKPFAGSDMIVSVKLTKELKPVASEISEIVQDAITTEIDAYGLIDSGTLRASIVPFVQGNKAGARSNGAPYALFVNYGTARGIKPRPAFDDAAENVQNVLQDALGEGSVMPEVTVNPIKKIEGINKGGSMKHYIDLEKAGNPNHDKSGKFSSSGDTRHLEAEEREASNQSMMNKEGSHVDRLLSSLKKKYPHTFNSETEYLGYMKGGHKVSLMAPVRDAVKIVNGKTWVNHTHKVSYTTHAKKDSHNNLVINFEHHEYKEPTSEKALVVDLEKGGPGSGRRPSGMIKKHPMYTNSDYQHLSGKGYSDDEIKKLWDRDHKAGNEPLVHKKAPDVVGVVANKDFYKKGIEKSHSSSSEDVARNMISTFDQINSDLDRYIALHKQVLFEAKGDHQEKALYVDIEK